MSKKLYHEALERELRLLSDQMFPLKARLEGVDGMERFWLSQQVNGCDQRHQRVTQLLRDLDCEGDGFWEDVRVEFRRVSDEMANGIAKWLEHLDAKYADLHWDRY